LSLLAIYEPLNFIIVFFLLLVTEYTDARLDYSRQFQQAVIIQDNKSFN
jgi:hypothetical protein